MSELKMISPLLDGMTVEKQGPSFDGRTYYTLRNRATGEQLMLKVLSVPSSDSHVRALILSGAYPDEAAVNEYYRRYTEDIRKELKLGKELTEAGFFAGALDFQVEPRESEVGFDIYILLTRQIPLSYLLNENAITGLRAINLGIDICDALISCREAGLLFTNLTPDNIYLTPGGKFQLGGLGLTDLEELEYSSVPEEYIGAYSAPELSDITESPNTTIDLYALGMVLFRIYNGNHGPYEDENTGEGMADKLRLSGKPLPTPIYADYELAGIIQKACAFEKEDRFQTPEEMKQALVLYMQRNQVTDRLIVPPIVVNFTPPADLPEEEEEDEVEPIRMTKSEALDDTFRQSFSPDLSGAGTDADIDPTTDGEEDFAEDEPVEEEPVTEAPATEEVLTEETVEDTPEDIPAESEAEVEPQQEEVTTVQEEEEPEQIVLPGISGPASPEAIALTDELVDVLADEAAEPAEAEESVFDDLLEHNPEYEESDQIDIDSLLASINEVIGDKDDDADVEAEETAAAPETAEEAADNSADGLRLHFEKPTAHRDYVDTRDEAVSTKPESDKKRKLLPILIIAALVLAIGLVAFFLVRWYFVEATALDVTSISTDDLVVQLLTDDSADSFSVTCSDSHGNVHYGTVVADQIRFSGLKESTTYTLTIEAAGMHKLTSGSVKTHTVTTPDATHITKISACRGETDGSVLLTFFHEGPTPDDWTLTYSNEDGTITDTILFDGNAYRIEDLPLGENYTFSLENTEGIFIKDQYTVSYELLPIIVASDLAVGNISGNKLDISWKSLANTPERWIVNCEAEDIETITIAVDQTACDIMLPDLTKEYTITLSAAGMDESLTMILPANPIVVEDFSVTVDEKKTATVTWNTPAGTPDGGWYLSYNTVGSLHPDYILGGENSPIENNTVQIPYLIPGAEYRFTLSLTPEDAERPIFGATELTYTTEDTVPLDEFGISPNAPLDGSENFVTLYPLPKYNTWNYTDLRDRSTQYDTDDKIAVCVELLFQPFSSEEVHLCYAVRNSEGQVVTDVTDTVVWDDMWYRRRHASGIPMPVGEDGNNVPGEYKLEIYVNGKLFAHIDFTIA